jgi:hypothetical protein
MNGRQYADPLGRRERSGDELCVSAESFARGHFFVEESSFDNNTAACSVSRRPLMPSRG